LKVHSIPGEGTQVVCVMPCLRRERLGKSGEFGEIEIR